MLNARVVIKNPAKAYYEKEGIVVAINTIFYDSFNQSKETKCKVLIGDKVSSWIPDKWLEIVNDNYESAHRSVSKRKC
jgi:hypothetical protein